MLSKTVSRHATDGILVLSVENPPVNVLSTSVRAGLVEGLRQAAVDASIHSVIIQCKGKSFFSGSDITEFDGAEPEPTSDELIGLLDGIAKPVIAAIHTRALGGGLEVALACHYRVATQKTEFGFPEVGLGIIPGLGGTQRAPRLIGYPLAVDLITTGRLLDAKSALEAGLVDRLVDGELETAALTFARSIAPGDPKTNGRRVRDMEEKVVAARGDQAFFETARDKLLKARTFRQAPIDALIAIQNGLTMDFDLAIQEERRICQKAYEGEEAQALISQFFAERETRYASGITKGVEGIPIHSIGVVGSGAMGRGIAIACLDANYVVTLVDSQSNARTAAAGYIDQHYRRAVERRRIDDATAKERLGRLNIVGDLSALSSCDLVIEAIFENLEAKKSVFKELDAAVKPEAILATNTSGLDVNQIAAATTRPRCVIGMHFFNPANIMRLVEVVRGDRSAAEAVVTGVEVSRRLGKLPIVSSVYPGFIANRVFDYYFRQAEFLVEEGASPEEVDQSLEAWGMAMGPFAVVDLSGLDVSHEIRKGYPVGHPLGTIFPAVEDELFKLGRLGQKTGSGWYVYPPGGGRKSDPIVAQTVEKFRRDHGITLRKIASDEIVQRCIYALINEAAAALADGTASRASDIDIAAVHGFGFPARRGGPVFQADWIGLEKVLREMEILHKRHGYWWRPHPLLKQLVAEGKTLSSFGAT